MTKVFTEIVFMVAIPTPNNFNGPPKKKIVADFTVYFITKRVVSFIVKRSCKQNG